MKKIDDIHNYDEIINMPHPISKKHPLMTRLDRAAQFAPFAALSGHKEALEESERITDHKKVLDENRKLMINEKLQEIVLQIQQHPTIMITFFEEDQIKEGGLYRTQIKELKKIDEYIHELIFMDHTKIAIDDIYEIELL